MVTFISERTEDSISIMGPSLLFTRRISTNLVKSEVCEKPPYIFNSLIRPVVVSRRTVPAQIRLYGVRTQVASVTEAPLTNQAITAITLHG